MGLVSKSVISTVRLVVADVTERSGVNSSLTYYKPSSIYRVLTSQGRLLLKMSFQRDAVSLALLHHGVVEMTVDVLDSPPGCFSALPRDVGARSTAAMHLLVKDLSYILPSDRRHDDQLRSNADHQVVCRQVSPAYRRQQSSIRISFCSLVLTFRGVMPEFVEEGRTQSPKTVSQNNFNDDQQPQIRELH